MNYTANKEIIAGKLNVKNYLPKIGVENVKNEILRGLTASPKYISPKFFYDKKGSQLFEKITELDEYYPTRTEKKMLGTIGKNLVLNFKNLNIIELGSGDPSKIRLLLRQISEDDLSTITYFPMDISQSAIENASVQLANEFPSITITGIVADFVHQLNLLPATGKRLFCFLGSTIGNFTADEIKTFMTLLGNTMQYGDSLLLGMDMIKDVAVLEKAYNDEKGITAAFNKNILNVVNNLLDTNFDLANFAHLAFYNQSENRIEMHLKALKDITIISSFTDKKIHLKKGETIHTENSHKFNNEDIATIADWTGLTIDKTVTDNINPFSLIYFSKI